MELLETLPERVASVELQLVQLRDEMRGEFSATRAEMRAGDEIQRTLRDEIRAGAEETRRYMRILYEDLVARISLLHEGRSRPRKKPDPER